MPVDLSPIVIPVVIVYIAILIQAFRKKPAIGWWILGTTPAGFVVVTLNTSVESESNESMQYHYIEFAGSNYLQITTSRGDTITTDLQKAPELWQRFHSQPDGHVQVSMTGTYDFGHLRAYSIHSIEGVKCK